MSYTYYIYHRPTDQHYYGARWAATADPTDFWVTYFTSSRAVKSLIKEYGVDSFDIQIRKVFVTGIEARLWEHRVLKKLKVWKNSRWLNKTNGQPPICTYSRKGQGLGRKLSDKHKQSISKSNVGVSRYHSKEHIEKAAKARVGLRQSAETKTKIGTSIRKSKPQYKFTLGDQIFIGCMGDWADQFGINVKSASTTFCRKGEYKGWVRTLHQTVS